MMPSDDVYRVFFKYHYKLGLKTARDFTSCKITVTGQYSRTLFRKLYPTPCALYRWRNNQLMCQDNN
jgi:hypothetical protein